MASVTVTLPGLLARFTGGRPTVVIEAETVRDAVDAVVAAHPALEPHLFDGAGRPRAHLRLLHEGVGIEWTEAGSVALADGDAVAVLQAVSGG